ncbi:hypothetical protein BDP27DRAFT_1341465 [Rhodocollybia butyracea]|uniref:ARID domain-containing protein n=1 Tax=Rhodocollybia butyracea TaxID=206335 RepID=A0A9P5P9Q0_9AGAR|nr:hypothetical protein BDP27DRAFT_1341465 [Rhodocollybia butyracea]
MADRLSQYSMGHNFMAGGAGMMNHHQLNAMQQQQQQQPGQQQDSSQSPHPGMPGFNDQNRTWSQMQQMHQIRAQNGQDMNTPSTQQMADLLRSQNMAQMQSQQQRFGMNIGGPGPSQQSSFLDQQNRTSHNMQMGFSGMEQHNPNFQQSVHRQNMLQTLQGNQQHSRQLELMGLAQNQQNQNATNLGNRVTNGIPMNGGPQGLNPQNDIQPTNPNGMPQNSRTINVQGRTINLGDLTERATTLRSMIQTQEMQMRQLQGQRSAMPDNIFMSRMRTMQTELSSRKESLNKIMTLMNICMNQGNGGPINAMNNPSQASSPGNNGQAWHNVQPTQPPGIPSSRSPAPPHALPNNPPNNVPPRSGTTPQQNPFPMNGSQLNFPANTSSLNGSQGPSNLAHPNIGAPPMNAPTVIPPLDKARFETSYKQWCLTKSIVHDPRLLSIDSRQIDLFQLHCQVMREGGFATVNRKELWPVIGARLGVVHFPGNAAEPPKSGPAAAIHIQHVYKEYLSAFDTVYMASVMDSRRKFGQFSQGNPAMPVTPDGLRHLNPQQLRVIIACADKPSGELRARGMSESMISFIETHRSSLQNMVADQETFGNELRTGRPTPPGQDLTSNGPVRSFPPMNMNPNRPGEPPLPFQPGSGIVRPTREQLSLAHLSINRLKADYAAHVIPMMPAVDVPPENRVEYQKLLEMVFRGANDLDGKLAVYICVTKSEENTRKLLSAIMSVQHQRSLLASPTSPNPKYVVAFETLRLFSNQLQHAGRLIHSIIQNIVREHPQGPSDIAPPSRIVPPAPNPINQPPPQLTQPPRSMNVNHPPTKPPKIPPTPPASTPGAIPPTPTLDSAQIPLPTTAGVKRQREEDSEASLSQAIPEPNVTSASPVANEPSPPKRAKTDWEGPISESLQKKNQAVENVKTEEDATQLLEQVTELIKMAPTEDQASLSSDISDTLELILKGYGGMPDSDASFSSLGLGESLDASSSGSQLPSSNDFTEFFDFSLFPNEEEYESKVGTPDLISSSSTNPSPESQADADPSHHATALLDVKQEEYDPLRLGTLKEIDGGESAYYQSTDWKWDGTMTTLEQPWAIFNS